MLPKDKQEIQELLIHPAWETFKARLLPRLKDQLLKDLQAAARSGEAIRAATIQGKIDVLDVVVELPNKYLKG